MKTLAFLLFGAAMANAQLLIDDFSSGTYAPKAFPSTTPLQFVTSFQKGTMAGGTRLTNFGVTNFNGNGVVVNQPCTLAIGFPPLFVECGVKATHELVISYGYERKGPAPLNLSVAAYDRFRLQFDTSSTGLNVNIEVFQGNASAIRGFNIAPNFAGIPLNLDFLFSDFVSKNGTVDFTKPLDIVAVIIQSGNATGGDTYILNSLTARFGQ
jgi:hypothetical protein